MNGSISACFMSSNSGYNTINNHDLFNYSGLVAMGASSPLSSKKAEEVATDAGQERRLSLRIMWIGELSQS